MGLPPSHRVSRVRCYSGYSQVASCFVYRAFTFFGSTFPGVFVYTLPILLCESFTPYINIRFGLLPVRSPLLRQSFIYFLFLSVLRCFSSRGSLHYTMCSCNDTHILIWVRSRIRTSTDLCSFAAPRSFSQLVTSFFGAWCQGIHRTLFFRLVIHTYRYVFLPEIKKLSFQSLFSFFLQDIYFDTSFFTRRFRMFYVLCFLLVLDFLLLLVSMFTFFSLFAVVNVRMMRIFFKPRRV